MAEALLGSSPFTRTIPQSTLLTTKMRIPQPRPDCVSRPRLIQRLNQGLTTPLTLVSAPAGFGKTTLVSEWARQSVEEEPPFRVVWLSLDEADNDPVRFWTYCFAALNTLCPGIGEGPFARLRSPQPPAIESVLTLLLNEVAALPPEDRKSPLVVVLDDYHLIRVHAIHAGLAFLLEHMPPHLRLVIATRADPPLPLARLRARGELTELRAADLRFTRDEAATFLNRTMRLNLSEEDVAVLATRTEGWIAGLQLAALSVQGRDDAPAFIRAFSGSHRYVLDYLAEEVFERQPEDVQAFLLRTCLLKRLTGPLCDAMLDDGKPGRGQAMLERLEAANLFLVPLDDERRWYRYHSLFAEFLQARLRRTRPALIPELHRRAAAWHARQGLLAEAIGHALAAEDFEGAAELIERVAETTVFHREVATLLGWLDALPEALVRARPTLCLYHAWARVFAAQFDAAEARLQDLERFGREDPSVHAHVTTMHAVIACHRGQVARAVECSRQALKALPPEAVPLRAMVAINLILNLFADSNISRELLQVQQVLQEAARTSRAAGDVYTAVVTRNFLATLKVAQGQLPQAADFYRQTLRLADDAGPRGEPPLSLGATHIGLAKILYEWNDLDGAMRHLTAGIELNEAGASRSIFNEASMVLAEGYATLARVSQAQGDAAGARRAMQAAEEHAQISGGAWLTGKVAACRARLALLLGDLEEATRWAETCGPSAHDPVTYRRHEEYTTLARVLTALGRPEEALALLDRLLQAVKTAGLTGWAAEGLMLQALAWDARGSEARAMSALEKALTLAAPAGYVRLFVDEGTAVERLLRRVVSTRRRLVAPDYVEKLLRAFQSEKAGLLPGASHSTTLVEPLTKRELEVLHLLAAGLTNREIARELVITVGTVKRHLHTIYGKLGVRNRTQAAARTRELGLLKEQ